MNKHDPFTGIAAIILLVLFLIFVAPSILAMIILFPVLGYVSVGILVLCGLLYVVYQHVKAVKQYKQAQNEKANRQALIEKYRQYQ